MVGLSFHTFWSPQVIYFEQSSASSTHATVGHLLWPLLKLNFHPQSIASRISCECKPKRESKDPDPESLGKSNASIIRKKDYKRKICHAVELPMVDSNQNKTHIVVSHYNETPYSRIISLESFSKKKRSNSIPIYTPVTFPFPSTKPGERIKSLSLSLTQILHFTYNSSRRRRRRRRLQEEKLLCSFSCLHGDRREGRKRQWRGVGRADIRDPLDPIMERATDCKGFCRQPHLGVLLQLHCHEA